MTRTDAEFILGKNSPALFVEGFDDCIIGIATRFNMTALVSYDYHKIIKKLMVNHDLSEEDAIDHFNTNIIGAWLGEGTPLFIVSDSL